VIHAMPDQSVRVTSRFPQGHSTVYLDLKQARGFTLEQDRYRPETVILRMEGAYSGDLAGRYGDPAEAEADNTELNLMLADRHGQVPSPSVSPGRARRKGWGWKGAAAGLALGAVGAHYAAGWHGANANAAGPLRAALAENAPYMQALSAVPAAGRRTGAVAPVPRQPAAVPTQAPAPSQPPAPAPTFGLQP